MKTTRSATPRANAISWVTTIMVVPSSASVRITPSTSPDQLGVQGGGRLVEEHQLRLHGQRAGDRHPLLLTAGELRGIEVGAIGQTDHARAAAAPPAWRRRDLSPLTLTGASMTLLHAVMWGNRLNRWNTMPIRDRCRAMSLSVADVQLAVALLDPDQLTANPDPAAGQSSPSD